ncbi:AzlC family ABC transporter permease [Paraburkholderia sp. BCC1876]|uniref:AzlC family ABC transporter permease n=1 Tax=Paraburkholderia sp. BCC1876 TaxID=2676303 RepID=UPI001591088D|nr:AzlC family ABC transporter permease [Paraburkholderia sp. BCC1876]
MKSGIWKEIFQLTLPVGMGYLPTGFAFGVLAIQSGLSPMITVAMSVFIFAGALQFSAVPMLAAATGLGTVVLTTLLINLRHVLYAIPLLDDLPLNRASRSYVVAVLTDENYSLLTTIPEAERRRVALRVCLINHGYWILGTVLGVAFGAQAARWIPNLGFALPALFTILAIEQYLARRRWAPAMIGIAGYLIARSVLPGYALISALAFGLIVLLAIAVGDRHVSSRNRLDWSSDENR